MNIGTGNPMLFTNETCHKWANKGPNVSNPGSSQLLADTYSLELSPNDGETDDRLFARATNLLFQYRIYPPHILVSKLCKPDGKMAAGTTIIQRIMLGPVWLEAAVRVTDVTENKSAESGRASFTYTTLDGHPERGTACFAIEHESHRHGVVFSIETKSEPGHWMISALRLLTTQVQKRSNRAALTYFKSSLCNKRLSSAW